MACQVKRSNDVITDVLLSDGKTKSTAYSEILNDVVKNGIPDDVSFNVFQSLDQYVGKIIYNSNDAEEIALGLYANMYTNDFKSWYGDWTTTNDEPKIVNYNGVKVIKNKRGEIRSIYNLGKFRQTKEQFFKSVATKKVVSLQSQVKKVIDILNFRIKEARKQRDKANSNRELSFEEKTIRSKYFNDIIKDSIQKKEVLKDQNSIQYLFITAESDLDMAEDVLKNSEKATMGQIRIAYKAVETWKNINRILGLQTYEDLLPEDKSLVEKIYSRTFDLNRRLVDLSIKLIAKKYSTESKQINPNDLYNYLKGLPDVDIISSYTRDITGTGIPLINILAKIIQKANLEISKDHNRIYDIIDEEYNKVKNHPEIVRNGYSIFFKEQLNNAKEKTLGLVGRYSQQYYDKMRVARLILKSDVEKSGDNYELRRKAYDNYNAFISNNTFLFNSSPFVKENDYTDEQRQAVIDEVKQLGFTNNEIADIIKEAKRLYSKYEDAKERYRLSLEVDSENGRMLPPAGMTTDEYINSLLTQWQDEHDPLQYIEQMKKPVGAKYAYKGSYYTIKVAKKIVDGVDSKYYDENFARIASDPLLYNFYNFFKDLIKDNLANFPEEEVEDLQSNFLPVITEKLAKEYGINNLKSTVTNMDWIMDMFTTIEYERNSVVDPATGKEVYNLKSKFINEVVPIEQRSKDMVTMMKMFSDMGLIYKHKLQVQDYVDTISEIVKETQVKNEENEFGEKVVKQEAPKNLQAMVEYEVRKSFYAIANKPDNLVLKGRKFYHAAELIPFVGYKSEKYKKAKVLEEEIKQLRKEIDDENTNELDRGTKLQLLYEKKSEYNNLGGRSISFTAMGDSSVKYSRLIALALQPFSALRNLAIGGVNNMIHAVGGRDFIKSELIKATFLIKDCIVKFWSKGQIVSEESEKLLKFMADTGIVEGEDGMFSASVLSKETPIDKIKKVLPNAYTLMKSTDFLFKSQTAVAMGLNQKIKLENGETISLYKALNNKLEFNEEKYGKYNPELNGNQSFDELYNNFMLRVGQVGKKLHGLSTNRTSVKVKETVLGRMLFLFKSWLPETLANRYEKKKYDELLGREIEGYMRTFLVKAFDEGIGKAIKAMLKARFSKEVGDMSELERENLRKAFAEINAIMTMTILYLAAKAMAPDDDDEKKTWNIALNQMKLLQRDMLYYFDVTSFESLTAQVVPSFTSLVNLKEAVKAVLWHYPAGQAGIEEDENGEPLYDEERTFLKVTKAIPILNNYNRILYYEKKLDNVR